MHRQRVHLAVRDDRLQRRRWVEHLHPRPRRNRWRRALMRCCVVPRMFRACSQLNPTSPRSRRRFPSHPAPFLDALSSYSPCPSLCRTAAAVPFWPEPAAQSEHRKQSVRLVPLSIRGESAYAVRAQPLPSGCHFLQSRRDFERRRPSRGLNEQMARG